MNELKHSYNKSRQAKQEFHKLLKVRLAQAGRSRTELEEYLSKKLKVLIGTVSAQLTNCNFKDKNYEKVLELIEEFFKEN
jgi:hypothetical protein